MRQRPTKVMELALAALLEIADKATAAPHAGTLWLRALLALVYAHSDRRREPYATFWRVMTEEVNGTQAAYVRGSYARTAWLGIVRSVGLQPEPIGFEANLRQLIIDHAAAQLPEARHRQMFADAVKEAGRTREIIATKGHPRSAEARALINERVRDGAAPDGSHL